MPKGFVDANGNADAEHMALDSLGPLSDSRFSGIMGMVACWSMAIKWPASTV